MVFPIVTKVPKRELKLKQDASASSAVERQTQRSSVRGSELATRASAAKDRPPQSTSAQNHPRDVSAESRGRGREQPRGRGRGSGSGARQTSAPSPRGRDSRMSGGAKGGSAWTGRRGGAEGGRGNGGWRGGQNDQRGGWSGGRDTSGSWKGCARL
jgi:hypothetical protein